MIVYIDDVLIFSENIQQHFKHLNAFVNAVKNAGLVVSARKISLCQTKIRFLGHNIFQGTIVPIDRAIEVASKFPDIILEKTELHRCLGCSNYIADFIRDLAIIARPLYDRLKKNHPKWTDKHTLAVQHLKGKAKELPCLVLADPNAYKIIECDASELGLGGILTQRIDNKEQIVRFTSKAWNSTQQNYSTIKKEIIAIVYYVTKFQSDILNTTFLIRTN
ncbi:hypothetical protein AMTRI_Chr02g261190 [Amborella trichopoda]